MPMIDFHRTAYQIYSARGDTAKALQHLEAFKRLDDEQRSLIASASAALMNAKFKFTTQEVQIARLDREKSEAAARFRSYLQRIRVRNDGCAERARHLSQSRSRIRGHR